MISQLFRKSRWWRGGRLIYVVVLFILVAFQYTRQQGLQLERFTRDDVDANFAISAAVASAKNRLTNINNDNKSRHFMSACLIVRNDNRMLAQWIAYHYTVLPLRQLIVAVDENSTEDPMNVVSRWNGSTALTYQVWYPRDYTDGINYSFASNPNRYYLRRQHRIFRRCLEYFHRQGNLGWVALVDTDEYIALNPLDDFLVNAFQNITDNEFHHRHNNNNSTHMNTTFSQFMKQSDMEIASAFLAPNETLWHRIQARMQLRHRLGLDGIANSNTSSMAKAEPRRHPLLPNSTNTSMTVLDVLEEYSTKHGTLPCLSMSRRRYSLVTDNFTTLAETICRPTLNPQIMAAVNVSKFPSIQLLYHVSPLSFKHNKWAKVLVDLRRVPYEQLVNAETRAKTHAPLDECPGSYLPDIASLLTVHHYAVPWKDNMARRGAFVKNVAFDYAMWSSFAHARDHVRCHNMHGWLNDLVDTFGMDKAIYLLGE